MEFLMITDQQFDNCNNGDSQLPPGFRFHPTDEELISCYLLRKVLDGRFTCRAIADVDLNKCEPWELPQRAKMGEKEWYFFSVRDRKYPTGLRTNRATKAGYWKATGKDREIYSSKSMCLVGMKKTLVFYGGRAPKGEKTNWVMHEYRLDGKLAYHFLTSSSKEEHVISRVFQKTISTGNGGSGTKRPTTGMNSYQDAISSTSVSLPPYASGDHDSYSYDSNAASKQHVPCFSTDSASNYSSQSVFDLPPPPLSAVNYRNNVGVSAFPSLRALQDNIQLPLFSSSSLMPEHGDGVMCSYGYLMPEVSPATEKQKAGLTELDCIWSF
ncbi:hypothetical protein R6Q59_012888 [Mikania micrantha]|uniref:NAC domain-containing protein n=1 Tax=Mikania micrantha TaxID=192012 RepID=A0A5N6LPW1_9ASTR|nr:hypothetical protein E3N88_40888 [Mikania micrantha]